MKNLKENSDLFQQKDIYNTAEFRSYMKRQWEILFLQNAKAEEASNMGLNMYIWSVRNTAWVLQSMYSPRVKSLPCSLNEILLAAFLHLMKCKRDQKSLCYMKRSFTT